MCVAVVIESPRPVPTEQIRLMAETNPDGGGVAWIDGDTIQFRKGLTWQEVAWLSSELPRPFLMHFRIATRGEAIPELTHPFPVGWQALDGDLSGSAPAVVIHNGTWNGYDRHIPRGIDPRSVSDTQIAALVAGEREDILDHVGWSNAIMRAAGHGRADLTLRGNWHEFEGNLYSNLHWQDDWRYWRANTPKIDTRKAKEAKAARKAAKRARRNARLAARGVETVDLYDLIDAVNSGSVYLDQDWEEIDRVIRSEGIKI